MPHILKNKNLEIHIDAPLENYNFSRFDWTGKITEVKFQGLSLTGSESLENKDSIQLGKGFYNEFGIDTALGFEAAEIGGWFHKIGIGLLKKTDTVYGFGKPYDIQPAEFTLKKALNKLIITCQSKGVNGFAYLLTKTIELEENSFNIHYALKNTGEKTIQTDEYVHNFICINQYKIGPSYQLKFPFRLQPMRFEETVNPEKKAIILRKGVQFNGTPITPFFFSNLSGGESVSASWQLISLTHKIKIRESGDFKTDKVNLWGNGHVISPELFFKINILSGQTKEWTRQYEISKFGSLV